MKFYRPPREMYVRAFRPTGHRSVSVEPGVEFRDGDSFKDMSDELYCLLVDRDPGYGERDIVAIAESVELAIKERWPDRAYFLEVHGPGTGWIQIFQPFGVPRNQ